jgi:hypothetical protein
LLIQIVGHVAPDNKRPELVILDTPESAVQMNTSGVVDTATTETLEDFAGAHVKAVAALDSIPDTAHSCDK